MSSIHNLYITATFPSIHTIVILKSIYYAAPDTELNKNFTALFNLRMWEGEVQIIKLIKINCEDHCKEKYQDANKDNFR